MTARTPEEASTVLCPLARTFAIPGQSADPYCIGPRCAVWRWIPMTASDPRFVAAVRQAQEAGIHNRQAPGHVLADKAAYGLPTGPEKGVCGMGGAPT